MATTIEQQATYIDPTVLRSALGRVAGLRTPAARRIGVVLAGQPVSVLALVLAGEKYGADVVPIIVADASPSDVTAGAEAAVQQLGLVPLVADVSLAHTHTWLSHAIFANANATSIATLRTHAVMQQVEALAAAQGCDFLMDGSIGDGLGTFFAGDAALAMLPSLRSYGLTQSEMHVLCEHWNVPTLTPDCIESDWAPLPQQISVTFVQGLPSALDGESLSLAALVAML